MNKVNRRILTGVLFFSCAIAAIGGASVLSEKIASRSVQTSVISEQKLPVIVLDAGHGEYS